MSGLRAGFGASLLAALIVSATGCASGGARPAGESKAAAVRPEPAVQPELPAAAPAAPEARDAPGATPEPQATEGAYGPKTVVIDDPQTIEETSPTLAEAARLAREGRAEEGSESIAVITDETLPEYATGELSIAEEKPGAAKAAGTTAAEADPLEAAEKRGEEYWRERVRGARIRWRDLVSEIEHLEGEVALQRQRFYAEDDGFYRDSQIKPAWDRALDLLAETRDEVGRAEENLTTILEEGRLAGALPGWLREGIEYEPVPKDPDEGPGIHEATEPQVVGDDGGEPRP